MENLADLSHMSNDTVTARAVFHYNEHLFHENADRFTLEEARASQRAHNLYRIYSEECKRRDINPFLLASKHPQDLWPVEWQNKQTNGKA